jgi:outer membrane protein assembly factor BamA
MIYRQLAIAIGLIWLLIGLTQCCAWVAPRSGTHGDYSVVVDTIIVEGAHHTKPYIILREMAMHPGDRVTPEEVAEDRDRVENLGLFNRVEMEIQQLDNRNVLVVIVTEQWYIFPLPFWRKEGGDFSKITVGFEYLQKNFRGRNERISASAWMGFEEGYQLSYFNPWFAGQGTWGLNIDAFKVTRDVNNAKYRKLGAEMVTTGGQAAIERRFGLDTRLDVTFSITGYRSSFPDLMASGKLHDNWIAINLALFTDKRDLYEYPTEGWYRVVNVTGNALTNGPGTLDGQMMISTSCELRHYHKILGDFILCDLMAVGMSGGNIPPYRRYLLGSDDGSRIRGWRGEIEEGTGIFLGSVELRRNIFNIKYFTWEHAPVAKRYFRNLKYGLSGGLFFDLGQTWIHPSSANSRKFQSGWGAELFLRLPYVEVLRLEAAWSPHSNFKDAVLSVRSRIAF